MACGVSLPADLVAAVLDHADIQRLLAVSHVCALWRSTAHAHPVFWRDVSLTKLSLPAARLFDARLRSTRGNGGISVSIDIEFDTGEGDDGITTIAFPAVQRNLDRIIRLSLRLPTHTFDAAIAFLEHPVPMLKYLSLAATEGYSCFLMPRMAERLFGGSAPELRSLVLRDVEMLDGHAYCDLLGGIESLRLIYRSCVDFPGFFAHFPSLRQLDIYAENCTWVRSSITTPLVACRLRFYYGDYKGAFECFSDLGNITHLAFWMDDSYTRRAASNLLGVLDGTPLKLTVLDNRISDAQFVFDFGVMFSCADGSRAHTRSVHVVEYGADLGYLARMQGLFLFKELRARVSHLCIPARQASSLSLIKRLPACEVLEVAFDDDVVPTPQAAHRLRLKSLQKVVVTAPDPVSVSGERLVNFLRSIIGAPPPPQLMLYMDNVHVVG